MRLINVNTLKLEETSDERSQKYAILSHRWTDHEISFQQFQDLAISTSDSSASYNDVPGLYKILASCEQARAEGLTYLWVDTCCINKAVDATELREAINSMYRWYQESAVCYAYLQDVSALHVDTFIASEWWTRGWTLQELLAPRKVVFFDRYWRFIGDKHTLSKQTAAASNIHVDILSGKLEIHQQSIAERMSWTVKRSCTKVEDNAYCLLGIFGVTMIMNYGERAGAFIRLQEEIIKHSDDHSIFAWSGVDDHCPGLLATNHTLFNTSGGIREDMHDTVIVQEKKGVTITVSMTPCSAYTYSARLRCTRYPGRIPMPIYLRQLAGTRMYARVKIRNEDLTRAATRPELPPQDVTVIQKATSDMIAQQYWMQPNLGFELGESLLQGRRPTLSAEEGASLSPHGQAVTVKGGGLPTHGFIASLRFEENTNGPCVVLLGFDIMGNPVCVVARRYALEPASSAKNASRRQVHDIAVPLLAGSTLFLTKPLMTLFQSKREPLHRGKGIKGYSDLLDGVEHQLSYDGTIPNQPSYVVDDLEREGIWLLRGDRVEGINVILMDWREDQRTKWPNIYVRIAPRISNNGNWLVDCGISRQKIDPTIAPVGEVSLKYQFL